MNSKELKKIRAASGLSQVNFSQRYLQPHGWSVHALRQWESGRNHIPDFMVEKLKNIEVKK